MQKKSSKRKKLSKKVREWLEEFIKNEVRHGTPKEQAKRSGLEVIHTLSVDH